MISNDHFYFQMQGRLIVPSVVQSEEGSDTLLSGQLTLLDLLVLSDMFSFLFNRKDVEQFYFAIAKTMIR